MGSFVNAFVAIMLFLAIWFPQTAGYAMHNWLNELKVGWQQVQDK